MIQILSAFDTPAPFTTPSLGKSDLLQKAGPVSVSAQDMPLVIFLDFVMKDRPINYKIADKAILLYNKPAHAAGSKTTQEKESGVTGRVMDSTGVPLIGATMQVMGGGRPVVTDMEKQSAGSVV